MFLSKIVVLEAEGRGKNGGKRFYAVHNTYTRAHAHTYKHKTYMYKNTRTSTHTGVSSVIYI